MQNNLQAVEALNIINRLLPLIDEAEKKLKSARNWSIVDMLGGGIVVDLIKHHKLNGAADLMNEANYLLQRLQELLGSVSIPADYRMHVGGFATFADFLFDGILADAYMSSKIFSSLEQVRMLRKRLYDLRDFLQR